MQLQQRLLGEGQRGAASSSGGSSGDGPGSVLQAASVTDLQVGRVLQYDCALAGETPQWVTSLKTLCHQVICTIGEVAFKLQHVH